MPEFSSLQAQQIKDGMAAMGLPARDDCLDLFLEYLKQLRHWNKAYNLTAIRDPADHVSRHLLDSLSIATYLKGDYCWDVGTGAGLPGLILAIYQPSRHWLLVDSAGKRMRFLQHCCQQLALTNVTLCQRRIEDIAVNDFPQPATLCSRAFRNLVGMLNACDRIISNKTVILAMKGPAVASELLELPDRYKVVERVGLHIPGLAASHELVSLRRRPEDPPSREFKP